MTSQEIVSLVAEFEKVVLNLKFSYSGGHEEQQPTIAQCMERNSQPLNEYCTCVTCWWVRDVDNFLEYHRTAGSGPTWCSWKFFDLLTERGYFKKGIDFFFEKKYRGYCDHDRVERNDNYCLWLPNLITLFREYLTRYSEWHEKVKHEL